LTEAIMNHKNEIPPHGDEDEPLTWRDNDYADVVSVENLSSQPVDDDNEAEAPDKNTGLNILDQFALNGKSEQMKKKMLEDKFVLGRTALYGQATVYYGGPNAGKTLLTLAELKIAIKSGRIDPQDVFYINADDTHKGLVFKVEYAESLGFKMLAPGHNGFKADNLLPLLGQLVAKGQAKGKIIILDTVKKFTDLMDKKKSSNFTEAIRQFVSHGGTVIMLAHVNKHRGDDKKPVHSGTTDLKDDSDCAYILDVISDEAGVKTVKFQNDKARGDVAKEVFYHYDSADGTSYQTRLDSVEEIGKEEREEVLKRKGLQLTLERNRQEIDAIKDCIRENINQKTALINEARERSGLTKKKISRALMEHTGSKVDEGQFWHINIMDKNAHVYQLNYGVS